MTTYFISNLADRSCPKRKLISRKTQRPQAPSLARDLILVVRREMKN